jgi:hypothetical protein
VQCLLTSGYPDIPRLGEIPAVICANDESGAIGGSLNGVWCQDSGRRRSIMRGVAGSIILNPRVGRWALWALG